MKKITAIFLTVLLLSALFCTSAFAEGTLNITVSTVEAKQGDEVTVTVSLSNNPGIAGLNLGIEYDSTVLEKVSFEGTGLPEILIGTNAVWIATENSDYNGALLLLKFKVKDDAVPGQAEVAIICNQIINDTPESVPANIIAGGVIISCEHTWDAGEITTAPSCETAGVKTFHCTKCGEIKTEEIAPLGHQWDNGEITVPASCTVEGVKTFTCSVCGATRTENTPASHQPELINAKPATCTEKGYSGDTICKVCGTVLETGSETPLAEHAWDLGTVTKEATCTDKGEKSYECENCGAVKTEELAALGHKWDNGQITKEPTNTETGEKTYTCTVCGSTKTESLPLVSPDSKPKTGDDSSVALWISLLILSGASAAAAFTVKRRKAD